MGESFRDRFKRGLYALACGTAAALVFALIWFSSSFSLAGSTRTVTEIEVTFISGSLTLGMLFGGVIFSGFAFKRSWEWTKRITDWAATVTLSGLISLFVWSGTSKFIGVITFVVIVFFLEWGKERTLEKDKLENRKDDNLL